MGELLELGDDGERGHGGRKSRSQGKEEQVRKKPKSQKAEIRRVSARGIGSDGDGGGDGNVVCRETWSQHVHDLVMFNVLGKGRKLVEL
jgi:hypothetical protein